MDCIQLIVGLENKVRLLEAANEASAFLLNTSKEDFGVIIIRSMQVVARAVNVDRMYIMKNHLIDGELGCTQIFEWSENVAPQQGGKYVTNIIYRDIVPTWPDILSQGKSINSLVEDMSFKEQAILAPQGIVSILVVPVFINHNLWGVVGFDDCRHRRLFSGLEERILRSISLSIANAIHKNGITEKIGKLQNSLLRTMSDLVEYRDNVTGCHVKRTKNVVKILLDEIKAKRLFKGRVDSWDTDLILQSAQLHDIGKIAIPDQILKKPSLLTKEEYAEIKKHAIIGYNIIKRIEAESGESELLSYAQTIALTHHERWDGTGYPFGIKGADIPIEGRIMAIADVYDALTSERTYKEAISHEEAVKIIQEGRNTHFDPVLTDLFVEINEGFKK